MPPGIVPHGIIDGGLEYVQHDFASAWPYGGRQNMTSANAHPSVFVFVLKIIYLFLAVSGFSCGTQVLCCGLLASLQLWHVGFLFSSCGVQAPEHVGSVVCSMQAL